MIEIVETIRPKLVLNSMFLVGLDNVGDKLMVMYSAPEDCREQAIWKVWISIPVIQAIENKVKYRKEFADLISNKLLATI